MIDNQLGYFDYDDPCDYEEWCAWDDPEEGGTCGDPYRSDVTDGGGQVFGSGVVAVRNSHILITFGTDLQGYPVLGYRRPGAGQFRSHNSFTLGDAGPHM